MAGRPFQWKPGLLAKIAVALAAVAILPLILVSWRLIELNRNAFRSQVLSAHALAARTTSDQLTSFIQARLLQAQHMVAHQSLTTTPRSQASQQYLSDILNAPEGIAPAAVVLRNLKGEELIRAQHTKDAQIAVTLLNHQATKDFSLIKAEGFLWLQLTVPFADGGGYGQVLFPAEEVYDFLSPLELGKGADLAILDHEKRILAGSKGIAGALPISLVEVAMHQKASGSGKFRAEDGHQILGAYAPLGLPDWVVVSIQPLEVAETVAVTMRRRAMEVVGLALMLAAALTLVSFFSAIRPLRDLLERQQRLAGLAPGELGGDVIQKLKQSFEALERHIRKKEALGNVYLGRYQVRGIIGEGAMGSVFKGFDPKLKREVALKTVRFDRLQSSGKMPKRELVSQLLHEAVTAANINHTNVVGVYDVEDTPEVAFVAMEYVPGVSLHQYLRQYKKVEPGEVLYLARELAKGLGAAHYKGICHRDIKPANILLNKEGGVKLADFGISQWMAKVTQDPNKVYGTPGFLPPETLQGKGFGPPGDFFALGVVLYRCLTGRFPFKGKTPRDLFLNTMVQDVPPPREINSAISMRLNDLVLQLLVKDPNLRIQHAHDFIEELDEIAHSVTASPLRHIREIIFQEQRDVGLPSKVFSTRDLDRSDPPTSSIP